MNRFLFYSLFLLVFTDCKKEDKTADEVLTLSEENETLLNAVNISEEQIDYIKIFSDNPDYNSDGFDFPIGKPNGSGYYNAQKFQENNHLGDDWNGVGGGNSDLGDPICSIANGYISEVKNYEGGWGRVVRIVHSYENKLYESLYAHCDSIVITEGQLIKKGEQIATIGNCNGLYFAHLHLEIRDAIGLDIGTGYSSDTTGYLDPTSFINKNRY